LGIRDQGRRKKGVGMSAHAAEDPADAQGDIQALDLDRPIVIPMDSEAGGMAAGADQLMELEA